MLILRANTDDLELVTGSAADIEVHLSAMQADASTPPVVQPLPNLGPAASITTATTTQILDTAALTSGHVVNVKHCNIYNNHASQSCVTTVQVNDGTNTTILAKVTLLAGESLVFNESGTWLHYDSNGVLKTEVPKFLYNASTTSQGPGFATDTYATGSFIVFPTPPKVGSTYTCLISVSKTAAGTATPILTVRVGTAGTTSDTGRGTHTFSAGTAATDVGMFEIIAVFRSVGSGTSAVLQSHCRLVSQPTTGFSSLLKGTQATSGGFDSTTAGLGIGVSVNGGTSASWTVQLVEAIYENVM